MIVFSAIYITSLDHITSKKGESTMQEIRKLQSFAPYNPTSSSNLIRKAAIRQTGDFVVDLMVIIYMMTIRP